jgi:tripartite-type tricarboxylate transporter receptor subunit TctC
MYSIRRRKLSFALVLIGLFSFSGPAFSQAPFYQGKTITVINGNAPGGTADMRMRAMLPFLKKHIPGGPTVVAEFMDGGGGRRLANHMYHNVRPDGLTIGFPPGAFVAYAVLGETGVNYDVGKFVYLGAPESATNYVFLTRKAAGIDSLEKLRSTPGLRVGAQSVGHTVYVIGRLFAYTLRLKEPRFVVGYSGPEVDAALLRGEVDGRANIADTILTRTPEYFEKNIVDFHSIINIPRTNKHPRFAHVPEVDRLLMSDGDRKLVDLFRSLRLIGSPYIFPPGVSPERTQVLRAAFRKIFDDPEFHKEYKKLVGDEPTPLAAEEVQRAIETLPREPPVIETFKLITSANPLPAR